jgi:hypothetical protein
MKTKIAIAVILGALFVAVPSATPKGKPGAGLTLSVTCNEVLDGTDTGTDFCSATASGLNPNGIYTVILSDNCGNPLGRNNGNGPIVGPVNATFSEVDLFGCTVTGVTASLYSDGRGGALTLLQTSSATII